MSMKKAASATEKAQRVDRAFAAHFPELLRRVALAALPVGAATLYHKYKSKKDREQDIVELKDSYQRVLGASKKISAKPEQAAERFRELSMIAPSVAKNPVMASRFLEPRLEKGLSIDDVHKLTMIQAYGGNKSQGFLGSTPGVLLDKYLTVAGPSIIQGVSAKVDDFNEDLKKEGSSAVSEECLATMLADRYVMWQSYASEMQKTAAPTDPLTMRKAFSKGLNHFLAGAGFAAAPLALAGMAHGVGAIIDAKRKADLERQANAVFVEVRRKSEKIQGEPEKAAEAFDALKSFAPALAVKPMIVKTFLEHAVGVDHLSPETVKSLAETQFNVNRSKPGGFATGFFGGLDSSMRPLKSLYPGKDEIAQISADTPVGGHSW